MLRACEMVDLDPTGVSPATFRKTWESWLIATKPERAMEIMASQGHTMVISLQHYLGTGFLPAERDAMKPYIAGWGE